MCTNKDKVRMCPECNCFYPNWSPEVKKYMDSIDTTIDCSQGMSVTERTPCICFSRKEEKK